MAPAMSTLSSLTFRNALADPALRESLLSSTLILVASGGLSLVISWLWVLRRALSAGGPPEIDWLIVCGHALEAGRPSAVYRQRLRRAGRLAADDPNLRLLLAGGGEPSEAAAGRDWLVEQGGVEAERIELEEVSTDTFANLRHARGLLPPKAKLGLVTSRFHLARVRAYARQLGLDVTPVPAEPRWRFTSGNLAASFREAVFLCWFVCGRFWAHLAQREPLLERLR